jgi:competence ComEA-like helix-hairpin-helix protein
MKKSLLSIFSNQPVLCLALVCSLFFLFRYFGFTNDELQITRSEPQSYIEMSKPDEFPIMINDIKRIASLYKLGNLRSGDSIVLDSSGTVLLSRISGIKSLALRIPIGINSASIKDLEALPGIGPKLAGRIVEYRNLNGPFKAIDELRNVDGIEEKKLEHIKPFINLD